MLSDRIKKIIKEKKYRTYHINEIMYYCDEFSFVTIIMNDDKVFRLDSIEEFIEFYNELKKIANDYDKLLVYQTEYIKFLKDMIVGFNKRIAYKKHHNWNYSNDVIQLVVYKKCLNQMNKIFKEEVK